MTQLQITYLSTFMALTATSLLVFPWWLSLSLLVGVTLAFAWTHKTTILKIFIGQFFKEFMALACTLTICLLWFWQLKSWLPIIA